MLEYLVKQEINPIAEAIGLLGVPGARAVIQSNTLKIERSLAEKTAIQNYLRTGEYTKVLKIDEKL